MQVADAFITGDLPGQPFVKGQRRWRSRRQGDATGQLQPPAFQSVDRTYLRAELRGQACRCSLGDLFRPQVTAKAHRHRVLGFLQPERAHCPAPGPIARETISAIIRKAQPPMVRLTKENAELELAGATLKPMTSRRQDSRATTNGARALRAGTP